MAVFSLKPFILECIPVSDYYLLLGFWGKILVVERLVNDYLSFFWTISQSRDGTPQIDVLMPTYVLLDFVVILPQVIGDREFFEGLQGFSHFWLLLVMTAETICMEAYHELSLATMRACSTSA